jgi:hypothetical protein
VDLPIATLSQILNDWFDYSNAKSAADYDFIQQTLSYNTDYVNKLHAGSSLDWFWATDTQNHLNNKNTDLRN